MPDPSSSKLITERVSHLENRLTTDKSALKNSLEDLTNYVKPGQIIQRIIRNRLNKSSKDSLIAMAIVTGSGLILRKFLIRKKKNILLKTMVSLLPFFILRTAQKKIR